MVCTQTCLAFITCTLSPYQHIKAGLSCGYTITCFSLSDCRAHRFFSVFYNHSMLCQVTLSSDTQQGENAFLKDVSQRQNHLALVCLILTLADTRGISYLPVLDGPQYFWRLWCPDPGWGLRGGAQVGNIRFSKKLKVEAERGVSKTKGTLRVRTWLAVQLLLQKKGWELPFP